MVRMGVMAAKRRVKNKRRRGAGELRTLYHCNVRHDARNDDEQRTDIVVVVVHQVSEITDDEQQSAQHDKDDTQVLFVHNI